MRITVKLHGVKFQRTTELTIRGLKWQFSHFPLTPEDVEMQLQRQIETPATAGELSVFIQNMRLAQVSEVRDESGALLEGDPDNHWQTLVETLGEELGQKTREFIQADITPYLCLMDD